MARHVCLGSGATAQISLRSLALLAFLAGAAAPALSQDDDDTGITEYEIACMSCHGAEGRGDGPLASTLAKPPSDLTGIARANGGEYPRERVRETIDGREAVAAHGDRDMPVWGERYRTAPDPEDTESTVDMRARAQIDALVRYIESIQEP